MDILQKKDFTLTRAEAEFIMKKEVPRRDFWIVDYFCDNYNRLQDVLDVLYNSLPGNNYRVSYLASQKGTRLVISCQICCTELTSFFPFSSHDNGKSHKRRQQQVVAPKDLNTGTKLVRRRLNEPKGFFKKGSLEDLIDSTNFTVLGVQFVYKECICGMYCFTCQLCQGECEVERINASRMFLHLRSILHNKKYMEVKYGHYREPDEDFDYDIKEIEELEGKIHNYIIDFTNQLPNMTPEGSRKYRCRRSRSSSESCVCLSSDEEHGRKKPKVTSPPVKVERLSPKVGLETVKSEIMSPEWFAELETLPLDLTQAVKHDVGVSVNMKEFGNSILNYECLTEMECIDMLREDGDMQRLLIQTLRVLNLKLTEYYGHAGRMHAAPDGVITALTTFTEKIDQHICELDVITSHRKIEEP